MQIYVGGSRHIKHRSLTAIQLAGVVAAALGDGHTLHIGCCAGADALAIQQVIRSSSFSQARVFAAFGPLGEGIIPSLSAVSTVHAFARGGGSVSWAAGGGVELPLAAVLIRRSLAALKGSSMALFFQPGRGSLAVAAHAVSTGIATYAIAGVKLPLIHGQAGGWVQAQLFGSPAWRWQPAQRQLL